MLRILIAGADPAVAGPIRTLLAGSGRSVVFARERDEAFALLRAEVFDVVVADVLSGEIPSSGLVRRLRRAAPHALLIVTSAAPLVEEAVIAIKEGAEDYIAHPLDDARGARLR